VAAKSNCRAYREGAIAFNGGQKRCNCKRGERERDAAYFWCIKFQELTVQCNAKQCNE